MVSYLGFKCIFSMDELEGELIDLSNLDVLI
jgi:hypothetical protein